MVLVRRLFRSKNKPRIFTKEDLEKNSQLLHDKFCEVKEEARRHGVPDTVIYKVFKDRYGNIGPHENTGIHETVLKHFKKFCVYGLIGAVLLSVFVGVTVQHLDQNGAITDYIQLQLKDTRCIIENNGIVMEIARPKTDCSPCQGLTEIPVLHNITRDLFLEKYAYSNVPTLVKDATHNWTAIGTFSFKYFQHLYNTHNGSYEAVDEECQFFPYSTEFESLREALNMSDSRADFKEGEKAWYVGW